MTRAYLGRKPKALSGGQRQRVAMGRAIVREPQVFLMDEPLSNLDAKLRVQTRTQIAALQRRLGVTTVYVTHDQVEAMTMGDRVAVLMDGVLQQVDTPRGLYDKPTNAFVAGFIGSPAMNLLEADIVEGAAKFGTANAQRSPSRSSVAASGKKVTVGVRPEDRPRFPHSGEGLEGGRRLIEEPRRRRPPLRPHRDRRQPGDDTIARADGRNHTNARRARQGRHHPGGRTTCTCSTPSRASAFEGRDRRS